MSKFSDYSDVELVTPTAQIDAGIERVKKTYRSGKTLPLEYRLGQLRNLYYGVKDNLDVLKESVQKDLHRDPRETDALETSGVLAEIDLALNSLQSWAGEKSAGWSGLKFFTTKSAVVKIPVGTVLLISPWNYPILLGLAPIVSAIAAGNTIVWKPSEVITHSTQALTKLVRTYLDPDLIQIVTGGIPETTHLLDNRWDKIMVTGSGKVGRVVAQAAAKHITPVILELGGKSPTFVGKTADLAVSAKRIAWGKLVNGGQTCVAPDYVLVDETVKDKFVAELAKAIKEFYPNLSASDTSYCHAPTDPLFDRQVSLLETTKGKIVVGGDSDRASRYIAPTVVTDVEVDDALMQDEIFGPILPIITVSDLATEGVDFVVTNHDTPLALYIFSNDKVETNRILKLTRSGGALVNDTLLHVGMTTVPFGGIGESGYGAYHGKFGFDAFTHSRAVVRQPFWADVLLKVRYPPYTDSKSSQMGLLSKHHEWYPRQGPVNKPFWKL